MVRFWSKVDKSGGPNACWPWIASHNKDGYGKFKLDGTCQNASRVALKLSVDESLDGMIVCHICDNRSCCNPKHLYAGSQGENVRDTVMRGKARHAVMPGVQNPRSVLTELQVREIRKRIAEGQSNTKIADDFPVSDSAISLIRLGKAWVNGGS